MSAAAKPFFVAVTPDAVGGRWGITRGDADVTAVYERFSATLGEALGSADTPVQVTEEQWRNALERPGVFFDYLYPQSLSVLAGWLGTETAQTMGEQSARRLCLAAEKDALALYYLRAETGEFYRCGTALTAASIESRLGEYVPNGAKFLWELTEEDTLDAYTLLEDTLPTLPRLTGTNPLRDGAAYEQLPELFGFSGAARSYTEAEGIVYVENDMTLRILNSGTVIYRGGDEGLKLGGPEALRTVVEAARVLCQRGPGACCGSAGLSLSALEYDRQKDVCSLRFDYAVDGIPVRMTEGNAVEMTVAGGRLTEATLLFRSYTPEEETVTPLPRMLALAAVRAVGGGEPLLAYTDNHKEIELQWLAQ